MKQPLQQQDEEQDIEADGGSLPPTLSVVRSDSIIVEDKSPDVKAIIEKEPPNTNPTPIFFRADDGLLHRAVEDAGRWAYGTVFVELWAWNDSHTALFRPEAGWWVDPVYHRSTDCTTKQQQQQGDTTNNKTTRSIKNYNNNHCPICRLTDSTRSDFVPPVPVPAGVGLPGVLWTEGAGRSARRSWSGSHPRSSQQQRKSRHRSERNSQIVLPDSTTTPATSSTTSTPTAVASHPGAWNKRVVWREVKAIANDPDQPWNPRMQILATLGLGWVAAVDFEKLGHSGILVYMARDGVQMNRLQSISNENYLVAASDFAAAAYALRGPRRCVVNERRLELTCVLRRVKNRILLLKRMGVNLEQLVSNNNNAGAMPSQNNGGKQEKDLPIVMGFWKWTCSNRVQKKAAATLVKARGGGVQIPPPMGWQQAWLTFFGCFLTMLIVTTVNSLVSRRIGPRYAYPIP